MIDDLNPEQLEAASHGDGPALVLAGPGTGKTKTLVSRYCRLVEDGIDPSSILTVTFSKKAAETLTQRIRDHLCVDTRSLPVSTFHAFCDRMRRNGNIPTAQGWELVKEPRNFRILRELRLASPDTGDVEDLAQAIARFKDRLETPEKVQQSARTAPESRRASELAVANAYHAYQDYLREHRLLDFGDMIHLAVAALRANGGLRKDVAGRFRFLMVDEYQDINPAQDALLELLLLGHSNIWVVGDDDQAIYGWRGSDVGYITEFDRRFPGAPVIRLERNYRSRAQILQVADSLIRNNRHRLGKVLRPEVAGKTKVVVCRTGNERIEAEWIVGAVEKLIKNGTPPGEIAVLVRTKYLTFPLEAALRSRKIPYVVRPSRDFWGLTPVKTMLEVAQYLAAAFGELSLSSLSYLEEPITIALNGSRDRSFGVQMRAVADVISQRVPASASAESRIEWSGSALQAAEEAKQFEHAADFLAYVEEDRKARRVEKVGAEAVIISTIHQAKGLEWEAVFVAGVERGILPHSKAEDQEEERRLAFVALTRAKRYLTVTYASRRGDKSAEPSALIAEMTDRVAAEILDERCWPEESRARGRLEAKRIRVGHSLPPGGPFVSPQGENRSTPLERERAFEVQQRPAKTVRTAISAGVPRLEPGMQVEHESFGVGVVVSGGARKVVVKFETGRTLTIVASYLTRSRQ